MDIIGSLATIALAGLIHASFQLSVSMLTLLSGHAIGTKTAHRRLLRMLGFFLAGTAVMTILLLSSFALWFQSLFGSMPSSMAWAMVCGLLVGLGAAIWIFYYRREPGTSLWLPRGLARYLVARTKVTRFSGEAFSLGMTGVIAEFLFVIGPMIVTALILIQLDPLYRLIGIGLYVATSLFSLLVIALLIASGHSLGRIQRWRENNKGFLQCIAGFGLLILAFFLYVNEVSGSAILGGRF